MPKRYNDKRPQIDIEATDFACKLLMPEKEFREIMDNAKKTGLRGFKLICKLQDKFQVPSLAIRHRACQLGYLKREHI